MVEIQGKRSAGVYARAVHGGFCESHAEKGQPRRQVTDGRRPHPDYPTGSCFHLRCADHIAPQAPLCATATQAVCPTRRQDTSLNQVPSMRRISASE